MNVSLELRKLGAVGEVPLHDGLCNPIGVLNLGIRSGGLQTMVKKIYLIKPYVGG